MQKFVLRRPSPALAVSLVALLVALGGTSYAAFRLPNNSVGSNQLKKHAVTNSKIQNGVVSKSKLTNGAVVSSKIANGAVGSTALANGAVGLSQLGMQFATASANVPAGQAGSVMVICPTGTTPIDGSGGWPNQASGTVLQLSQSTGLPKVGPVWQIGGFNGSKTTQQLVGYAVCVTGMQ